MWNANPIFLVSANVDWNEREALGVTWGLTLDLGARGPPLDTLGSKGLLLGPLELPLEFPFLSSSQLCWLGLKRSQLAKTRPKIHHWTKISSTPQLKFCV